MIKKKFVLKLKGEKDREYTIEGSDNSWWTLSVDGGLIAQLVNEEECRRVIWSHWDKKGFDIPIIKEDDFNEV